MKNSTLFILLLALGLLIVIADAVMAAEQLRFQRVERDPRPQRNALRNDAPRAEGAAMRLQGTLEYSHGDGLRVDGRTILVGQQTTIYGASDRDLENLGRLSGRKVIVFGRRAARGLRAELIIVRARDNFQLQLMGLVEGEQGLQPSTVNSAVGTFMEEAPQ